MYSESHGTCQAPSPAFWLVSSSQSWPLIGWLWAPAQLRPLLLDHLPHCGHDTDKLGEWEKWRAVKCKSERDLKHSHRINLPCSGCDQSHIRLTIFWSHERKKSLSCSVLWSPPCVINQSSIVNYHYLETLTIRSHAAVLININQSQPPRVFPLNLLTEHVYNVLLTKSRVPSSQLEEFRLWKLISPNAVMWWAC